jgi:hypothetical protein
MPLSNVTFLYAVHINTVTAVLNDDLYLCIANYGIMTVILYAWIGSDTSVI